MLALDPILLRPKTLIYVMALEKISHLIYMCSAHSLNAQLTTNIFAKMVNAQMLHVQSG